MSDERDRLLRRERGEQVSGDFGKYERLESALGARQAAARAPAGFEDRLWAALDAADAEAGTEGGAPANGRGRVAAWAAVAAVAAAALLWVAIGGGDGGAGDDGQSSAPRLAMHVERGDQVARGGDDAAQPGDRLRVTARHDDGEALELRLYRDDVVLVARCAPDVAAPPACAVEGDGLAAQMPLEGVGVYQLVVLRGRGAWPVATGAFDEDVAGALRAGASVDTRRVEVR